MRSAPIIVAITAGSFVHAQAQPAFEVASVKPVDPSELAGSFTSNNQFMGSLQALIRLAYGVEDYQRFILTN